MFFLSFFDTIRVSSPNEEEAWYISEVRPIFSIFGFEIEKEGQKMDYKIKIEDQMVEVNEETYKDYYRMDRRERYLVERDREHGVTFYHALEQEGVDPEALFADQSVDIERAVIAQEEREALYEALLSLNARDRELIVELFYNERTERELAEKLGIRHQNIHKRKMRILRDLRNFLEKRI